MCGIAGVYGNVDQKILNSMINVISHRGPDGGGVFLDKNIGLGHKRLSIIDLKTGDQPMYDKDKRYVIVFNGEIYNFKQIKADLEKRGCKFLTNSDTEVILQLYKLYGKSCLDFLVGMFGFAIYDRAEKSLFIARDRLGVKPLYYYLNNQLFVFASEIKSILEYPLVEKKINKNALYEFFFRQYIAAPDTIFQNIYKLDAGHYIFIKDGVFQKKKYWDLNYFNDVVYENYAIAKVKELLENSVKLRLVADVPLGAFLSGGIDSSIVVALMHKFKGDGIKTFSIGFNEEGYNEIKYAKMISDKYNTDHEEIILDSSYMDVLDKVIYHLDEPLADFAALPTYVLSEFARRKVKVVLTGEGGDENFAGYSYYRYLQKMHNLIRFLPFSMSKKIMFNMKLFSFRGINRYIDKSKFVDSRRVVKSKLLGFYFTKGNFLSEMLRWDTKVWLADDLLMKVDKMSMAHGLEARVPYLDHNLMTFTSSIHPRFKINKGIQKYILKKAFSDIVPKEIINREKHGFDVPVNLWFNTVYKDKVDNIISSNSDIIKEYFKVADVNNIMNAKKDNIFLWRLYNFLVWNEKFIGKG